MPYRPQRGALLPVQTLKAEGQAREEKLRKAQQVYERSEEALRQKQQAGPRLCRRGIHGLERPLHLFHSWEDAAGWLQQMSTRVTGPGHDHPPHSAEGPEASLARWL